MSAVRVVVLDEDGTVLADTAQATGWVVLSGGDVAYGTTDEGWQDLASALSRVVTHLTATPA